jgi:hypothetical protein
MWRRRLSRSAIGTVYQRGKPSRQCRPCSAPGSASRPRL